MAENPIGEVILNNVRLSFADLFKPGKPMKGDDGEMQPGKFKANLLMKVGTPEFTSNMAKLKAAANQVREKTWGSIEKAPKMKPSQICVRDGNLENWDGYEGCWYVSANNQNPPVLVDRRKDAAGKWVELTIENGGTRRLYSGCYVNAIVRLWGQQSRKLPSGAVIANRINASLESVQFFKDGDSFSGGKPVDPNEKFADVPEEEGETYGADDSGLI